MSAWAGSLPPMTSATPSPSRSSNTSARRRPSTTHAPSITIAMKTSSARITRSQARAWLIGSRTFGPRPLGGRVRDAELLRDVQLDHLSLVDQQLDAAELHAAQR